MEKRDEIKDAVKDKLIELLAHQITQEESFEQLKTELVSELLKLEDIVKPGRQLNSEDGYDPINEAEAKYKKRFGFIFNSAPVEERLNSLKKEASAHFNKNRYPNSLNLTPGSSLKDLFTDDFSNRFQERFGEQLPIMKELIKDEPAKELKEQIKEFKTKLSDNVSKTAVDDYNKILDTLDLRNSPGSSSALSVETMINELKHVPESNTPQEPAESNLKYETQEVNKSKRKKKTVSKKRVKSKKGKNSK